MKKLCKRCKKIVWRNNIIVLAIAIPLIIIVLLLILFNPIVNNWVLTKADKIILPTINYNFNKVAEDWKENNKIVKNIAELCNVYQLDKDKIDCVFNVVSFNFEHVEEGIFNQIDQPEEILNNGTECRGASVFYKSIFELMGYKVDYIFKPNHVYIKVYLNESYVEVDQNTIAYG